MRGESVEELDLVEDGVKDDRRYAFESSGAPAGKPMLTGRERAAMLLYGASLTGDGKIIVQTPEGSLYDIEDPRLLAAMQAGLPQGHRLTLRHGTAPFTDCRPVSLLSLQALAALSMVYGRPVDARRFRANLILHFPEMEPTGAALSGTFPEDALAGCRVRVGNMAELRITERDPRCRMVTLDPETSEADPGLMRLLDRQHDGKAGVYAVPTVPGRIHIGDPVTLISQGQETRPHPPPFPASRRPTR